MLVMAGKKRKKIESKDLEGFKHFKILAGLLEGLHDAGCERDRAGNRLLHMDQYMTLLLMFMFNPICSSLRAIQEASELKKVQRVLKVPRASLGSLSEAARVFDSELLQGVIGQLVERLRPIRHDARLRDFEQIITLVDGSWLRAVPKMIWALFQDDRHKAVKAHVEFQLLKGVPTSATITDANTDEKQVLEQNLQAGRLYVLDRGYAKYSLLQAILNAVDFGMDAQQAVAAPRFCTTSDTIDVSNRILRSVESELQDMGYPTRRTYLSYHFAGVHAIRLTPGGWDGGADPGRDGMALKV